MPAPIIVGLTTEQQKNIAKLTADSAAKQKDLAAANESLVKAVLTIFAAQNPPVSVNLARRAKLSADGANLVIL